MTVLPPFRREITVWDVSIYIYMIILYNETISMKKEIQRWLIKPLNDVNIDIFTVLPPSRRVITGVRYFLFNFR